jgi:hypothetical protein
MRVPLTSVALAMLLVNAIIVAIVLADQDEPHGGITVGGAGPGAIAASSSDNNKTDAQPTKKITLNCMPDESGTVCSNKTVSLHSLNVGYIAGGVGSQAFLSFNMSGIPDNAVIKKVAVDMRRCDVVGDPFLNLACLKAYPVFYDTLSPEEYYTGAPLGDIMRICTAGDLMSTQKTYPELVNALQDSVGSDRFQMRFQFERRQTFLVGKNEKLFSGKASEIHDVSSTGYTFVSGEWKPCDTEESKPQEVRSPNQKDLLHFGSVKLVVTYIPPEQEE